VLSHFAVLIKKLEALWWLRGWAENIVETVKNLVEDEYHERIEWPMQQVLGVSHGDLMDMDM
jgi:hypothetical protein